MAFGAEIAELIVALRLDDKGFTSKLKNAQRDLKGMGAGLSQIGTGAGQVGAGVGKIATVGAVAAVASLTGVIKTAASFEQAWAGVTKTVEGANQALLDDFKNLSREIPLSFEELAAIGAEGGALGIATEDLLDFTDIVARLAVSTDLSAEQASSSLGQLANVLDMESGEMRDFGDSLVALGNDGASTESAIIDMTARFGAAGKQAGLSNEAILALASTTASMGIEAEAGGGALSRIFNGITLDIATASKESQALAGAMDMSLAELRTAWDQDAGKVFQELLGYVGELDKFEAAEFLTGLGITNTRDINAITLLASGAEEYGRQLGVAEGQTNELNKESDVFFNTTEGKWKTLQNNIALAADSIGSKLLPIVNELGDEFVTWLSDPKVQKGIEDFATGLADGIRDLVAEIKNADFGPILDTLKGAGAIAKAGFDAFNALPAGVKSLALAAFGVNKLTGGALGDIAKGFGNIFAGGLKILFERGASPANPMWVQTVGGGLGGGVGGKVGGTARNVLGGVAKYVLGPLAAVAIGKEIAQAINDPIIQPAKDFEEKRVTAVLDSGDASRISDAINTIDDQLNSSNLGTQTALIASRIPYIGDALGNVAPTLERQRADLVAELARIWATEERGAAAARDAIPWAQRNLAEITRLNASEATRFSLQTSQAQARHAAVVGIQQAALSADQAMLQTARSQTGLLSRTATASELLKGAQDADRVLLQTANNYNSRTATASEITSRKSFDPKITVPVTVQNNVTVNSRQVADQVAASNYVLNGAFGPT